MIYTSGVVTSLTEPQTLEQLQDNKLAIVCSKLDLQPTDNLLDIGCGWGTLAAYAHKNFDCSVTGITLGRNQTAFGNARIANNGGDPSRAKIVCCDYRDIPGGPGTYNKIVSLEMAEVRRLSSLSSASDWCSHGMCSMSVFVTIRLSCVRYTTFSMTTASLSSKSPVCARAGNTRT